MKEDRWLTLFQVGLFLVSLGLSIGAFFMADLFAARRTEASFATITNDSRAALEARLQGYAQALDGLAGFLSASSVVSQAEWRRYVETLDIETRLPGLNGLGYIVEVTPDTEAAFLAEAAADGLGLTIHPASDRQEKMVVKFVAPLESNRAALGLDIAFDESRRAAAVVARASGQTVLSAPISLVQDNDSGPGLFLIKPISDPRLRQTTAAERQAAFRGWVYAPLIGSRFMFRLTASQQEAFRLRVIDLSAPAERNIVFDNLPEDAAPAQIVTRREMPAFGRSWQIEWHSTPSFEAANATSAKWVFLLIGLTLSALLAMFLMQIRSNDRKVKRSVEEKTRELSARVEQNRSIITNTVLGIFVVDASNRILLANGAAASLFGYSAAALRSMRLDNLLNETAEAPVGDRRLVTAVSQSGRQLYLDIERNHWANAKGEARQSVLIRDVTDITLTTRALAENERRWNMAMHNAEIGVFDVNLDTGTSVVSDTWRQLMGLPKGIDLDTQKHFLSRIHPEDLPALQAADRECIAGRSPRSVSEFRVRFGEKDWRWMRSDAVVVERDEDGRAHRLIGAQTNVHDLRQAREALSRSEDRFRLVLLNAPVGMAVLDIDGRVQEFNNAMSELCGYADDELQNFRFASLFFHEEVDVLLSQIAGLNGTDKTTYRGEHRLVRKDGDIRWGLVKVSCTYDAHQGGEIYIVQIHDITYEHEVDRVKGEFVATVSHELRTPLTSIKGALGLLTAQQDRLDSSMQRLLEIATTNSDRLIFLVNDILDLEKISSGKVNFAYGPHRAEDLIGPAVDQLIPYADKHNVRIEVAEPAPDLVVRVDPDRVAQVLANLLSNACKFSRSGGTVEVSARAVGDMVRFSVIDHGIGVPPGFYGRIFQPFSQADGSDTRQKGGTGLGLNISKQIIEAMGGEIGFESNPGVATEFWFTCVRSDPSAGARAEGDDRPEGRSEGPLKNVLHIEADNDFGGLVQDALRDLVRLRSVRDLTEAAAAVASETYDMIIIDWDLSDQAAIDLLDSFETLQPQARIVSLSATEGRGRDPRVRDLFPDARKSMGEVVARLEHEMAVAAG